VFTKQVDQMPPAAVLADIDAKVDNAKMEEVLMSEGLAKFADPHKALIKLIGEKRAKAEVNVSGPRRSRRSLAPRATSVSAGLESAHLHASVTGPEDGRRAVAVVSRGRRNVPEWARARSMAFSSRPHRSRLPGIDRATAPNAPKPDRHERPPTRPVAPPPAQTTDPKRNGRCEDVGARRGRRARRRWPTVVGESDGWAAGGSGSRAAVSFGSVV